MKTFLQKLLAVAAVLLAAGTANAQTVSSFEELSLSPGSYWDGATQPLGTYFSNGNADFYNYYDTSYGGMWAVGFAYSNMTDSVTSGYLNPYSAKAGSGYYNSANYLVGKQDAFIPKEIVIKLWGNATGKEVKGFYITNTTFAYNSMRDGDDIAKKFGGVTGNDADWFKLIIHKYLGGAKSTDSIEFFLADYRSSNNAEDYIVRNWTWLDLTSLGDADSLVFKMASSDVGLYGINTPTYFAIDNFTTSDFATGIANVKETKNVNIYPVPATDYINVTMPGISYKNVIANITDITGRVVMTESKTGSDILSINISSLSTGVYLVNLLGENISVNRKIVKK